MGATEPATFKECVTRLIELMAKVDAIRSKGSYSDLDARATALLNCRAFLEVNAMILNVFRHAEEGAVSEAQLRELLGATSGPAPEIVRMFQYHGRMSLLLMFQFQIENLWKNILRQLPFQLPQKPGYYVVARTLLEAALPPLDPQKLATLNVPALLRNSLHSNGIHHGQDVTIVVNGVAYEFRAGQRVSCAGWGHVVHALGAVLDVIDLVLEAPVVRALKDPIEDTYVWDRATAP